MPSLRRKITLSFSLLAGLILLLSLFAQADLLFLESHIEEGAVVALLKDDVLEMRRQEKNLLLYRNPEVVEQIRQFAGRAYSNLQANHEQYVFLADEAVVAGLLQDLQRYQALFVNLPQEVSPSRRLRPALFEEIRRLGHRISEQVNQLAVDERALLLSMTNRSQWALAGAILVMVLLAVGIGWRMTQVVSRPLKQLEKNLGYVANGRFDYLKPVTRDQEFITLTRAFNRMLQELDLRHRRLLQAEKLASLGVLVSGVAHELNNPLGNISSSCQLLLEELSEVETEQHKEWLQQIDNETERAKHIVRTLLEYGQKKAFEPKTLLLKDVIDKSLLLLRSQLKRNASLSFDVPEGFRICADMQRMQQVFINLIRNALNAGGNEIRIHAAAASESTMRDDDIQFVGEPSCLINQTHDYCEIVISDNGTGIAEEMINRIFDPFFTTSEPGHGTGLGLFIVQEIIQEHGGCIGVISAPNKGTQFVIRLPCGMTTQEDADD